MTRSGSTCLATLERAFPVACLVDGRTGRLQHTREEPVHCRVVVGHQDRGFLQGDLGAEALRPRAVATGRKDLASTGEGRDRHRTLGSTGGEPHGALRANRHDVADAGDGAPQRGEDLGPLAEIHLDAARLFVGRITEAASKLFGEASTQLIEAHVPQLLTHDLASHVRRQRAGACASQLSRRGRLGKALRHTQRGELRRILVASEPSDDDHRDELGQRVGGDGFDEIDGTSQIAIDHDHVGREGFRKIDGDVDLAGLLDLERLRRAFDRKQERLTERRRSDHEDADRSAHRARRHHGLAGLLAKRLEGRIARCERGGLGVHPRLSPRERRHARDEVGRRVDVLDRQAASVGGCSQRVFEALQLLGKHGKAQEPRPRSERMDAPAQVVSMPDRRRIVSQRLERRGHLDATSSQVRDEVGSCPSKSLLGARLGVVLISLLLCRARSAHGVVRYHTAEKLP